MRITGGSARGRALTAPKGDATRPTSDKTRQAIFNILSNLPGQPAERVLDLYAGSGALGLEAISRGASSLVAIDRDARATAVIQKNLAALAREAAGRDVRIIKDEVVRAVNQLAARGASPFGLVFIDPPYASDEATRALEALDRHAAKLLTHDATIIVEHDRRNLPPEALSALSRRDVREYGDTRVAFYSLVSIVEGGTPS